MRAPTALAAALALGLLAAVSAQRTTINQRYDGFTMASDVVGYTNMTKDACDLKAAVSAGDLTTAQDIYVNGKNSFSSARALRRYQSWSTAAHPGEQTYDLLINYHSPANTSDVNYLDNFVLGSLAAGAGARAFGLINVVVNFKYMMHEVDAALNRLINQNYTTASAPLSGAPHNLDEAFVIWAPVHPERCGQSPSETADRLAADMGTLFSGRSPINWGMTVVFNNLMALALPGSTMDATTAFPAAARAQYESNRFLMHSLLASFHAQGVLREAYAAELAANCGKAEEAADSKAHASSYWDALAPVLALRGAPRSALNKVSRAMAATNMRYAAVKDALHDALGAAKVSRTQLGKPSFARINAEWKCSSRAAPRV